MEKFLTKKPIIALSPMADHTDAAFCLLIKELAPSTVVFREMISAEALVRGNKKTCQMAEINEGERPLIQQIFGGEPKVMAAAAKLVEEKYHPDGIDINMGCPAKKIISNFNGSALMKDPETAAAIVRAVKAAVSVPVSVKMRLGWSNPEDCLSFAPLIEQAGADFISVHGRTKKQEYSGKADWEMIRRVKAAVSVPVLGNGDITSADEAMKALETGVDGILIGRGALGNPWIFLDIEDTQAGRAPTKITPAERARVILRHAELFLKHSGHSDLTNFRKHLVWYFSGTDGAAKMRQKISTLKNFDDLQFILEPLLPEFCQH
ncbi:TPA: tRNA dihydrouridine synthase DusB, partial [Candidatus Uhrbacteria bacterium]|nr:tRNA dihydrouridine synthase DusB [Candidatus Uhrbacteria bacterium]